MAEERLAWDEPFNSSVPNWLLTGFFCGHSRRDAVVTC